MSKSVVSIFILPLENCLEEHGIKGAWVELAGKATGSRGPLTPPGSGTAVRTHRKGQNLGFTPGVRQACLPPCPTLSLFTPADRKDVDQSLETY